MSCLSCWLVHKTLMARKWPENDQKNGPRSRNIQALFLCFLWCSHNLFFFHSINTIKYLLSAHTCVGLSLSRDSWTYPCATSTPVISLMFPWDLLLLRTLQQKSPSLLICSIYCYAPHQSWFPKQLSCFLDAQIFRCISFSLKAPSFKLHITSCPCVFQCPAQMLGTRDTSWAPPASRVSTSCVLCTLSICCFCYSMDTSQRPRCKQLDTKIGIIGNGGNYYSGRA